VEIWSDNGTNFKGAERELREAVKALDQNRIITDNIPVHTHIKWRFNPPSAPHFGGAWERMVGLVKKSLYRTLKTRAPKEEVLRSLLIEVENITNSRPLYYSGGREEIGEPAITPNHFLRLNSKTVFSPGDISSINYKRQWKYCQELAQEYWKRWIRDYLPTISTRAKWYQEGQSVKRGTLVLVVDNNSERNLWRRAIVDEVHPGPDGRIRTATVRTAQGTHLRPVAKLAIIKLNTDM
jgi:hypothetical protein